MLIKHRPRRLRKSISTRTAVAENTLQASDLIAPLFVEDTPNPQTPIASIPGYARHNLVSLVQEVQELHELGIPGGVLFAKIPDHLKDNTGKEAVNPNGLMPRAIRAIKEAVPGFMLWSDIALDPYSIHGHDGIVEGTTIVNDKTVEVLGQMAVVHAEAGVDFVAPSDMMDGRVGAIRAALDDAGYTDVGIVAYTAKYASCFYGPFRDALDSAPGFGDKKTYQMNPANGREALRELELDITEGADMVMVKPGLPYLDIVHQFRTSTHLPVVVYQVSGEYAMVHAAAEKGWLNLEAAMFETLMAFKRAGAQLVITYFARHAAERLQQYRRIG
jgi:porphobilinogen synthase